MFETIQPEIFATGFKSPEGPSFDRAGNFFFTDWDAGIYQLSLTPGLAPNRRVVDFLPTGGKPTVPSSIAMVTCSWRIPNAAKSWRFCQTRRFEWRHQDDECCILGIELVRDRSRTWSGFAF